MEVVTPDDPRLFLRCSYEVEGKSLSLTRAVCKESGRSTECRAFSLLFLGFSFPLRSPPKPLFPLVLLWSWLTFDVGMLCLSSLSTAYGNIMLIFLDASDDCVLAVKILFPMWVHGALTGSEDSAPMLGRLLIFLLVLRFYGGFILSIVCFL
ncbi:hypothetical protein V6N13_049437 [Hibiscus sabdariffa]|uniref:Uncharacterized protein n=1 Tax=Hibiscus sabdariffa TaxID=183260 RepID=A0ABR2QXQ6_9ROSI